MTYQKVDGTVLDLAPSSEAERAYVQRVWEAYARGGGWEEVSEMVSGAGNPMLAPTGGIITRDLYYSPAFQAIRDVEDRAGMRDGSLLAAPDFDPEADPLADEWIGTSDAAARKGVTLPGLHAAIHRGVIIARPIRPGGTHLQVSVRSLERWAPSAVRQAARRTVPR